MPLDRHQGEIIDGLGSHYYVAPFGRWATTPLFGEAYRHAISAFVSAGAIQPIKICQDQVLIQEYPGANKVAFVFQVMIAGKEHMYPYVFELPPKIVAELRLIGQWGRPH